MLLLSRCCRLTITSACESPVRTTWSASQCWNSTARLPSSPQTRSCSGPFTPSTACAAAARWALRATTARLRWISATRGRARTMGGAAAGREATPASAWRTSQVFFFFFLAVEAQKFDQTWALWPAVNSIWTLLCAPFLSSFPSGQSHWDTVMLFF